MAPYSSTLAWKIQWMEEPGGLQSMGSLRVGHEGRGKDGGGIGREDHFLPHKFLKRTFKRRANFTKQLL